MRLGWHSTARQRGARHGRGKRLRAAHAAEPGGQDPLAGEVAAVMLAAHLHEGLVGALHDALRADIDPRAGRHLAVHHEPLAIELVEVVPGGPVRHEVGVGDQHARRVGVRAEDADRLARLHQQRLVVLERLQERDDAVEALPVARRAADAAIDDELAGLLGDVRVEIVHQHAQRRFGQPALGRRASCRAAARITRALSMRVMVGSSCAWQRAKLRQVFEDVGQRGAHAARHTPSSYGAGQSASATGPRLSHIAAAGELHLQGVDAVARAGRSGA